MAEPRSALGARGEGERGRKSDPVKRAWAATGRQMGLKGCRHGRGGIATWSRSYSSKTSTCLQEHRLQESKNDTKRYGTQARDPGGLR